MSQAGWNVNRDINIGEIATIVTMGAVMLMFFFGLHQRVDKNEIVNIQQGIDIQENKNNIDEMIAAMERHRLENKSDLSKISLDIRQTNAVQNAKIDRIYEHIVSQGASGGS